MTTQKPNPLRKKAPAAAHGFWKRSSESVPEEEKSECGPFFLILLTAIPIGAAIFFIGVALFPQLPEFLEARILEPTAEWWSKEEPAPESFPYVPVESAEGRHLAGTLLSIQEWGENAEDEPTPTATPAPVSNPEIAAKFMAPISEQANAQDVEELLTKIRDASSQAIERISAALNAALTVMEKQSRDHSDSGVSTDTNASQSVSSATDAAREISAALNDALAQINRLYEEAMLDISSQAEHGINRLSKQIRNASELSDEEHARLKALAERLVQEAADKQAMALPGGVHGVIERAYFTEDTNAEGKMHFVVEVRNSSGPHRIRYTISPDVRDELEKQMKPGVTGYFPHAGAWWQFRGND